MNAERPCEQCLRETFHKAVRDGWRCSTCGTLTPNDSPTTPKHLGANQSLGQSLGTLGGGGDERSSRTASGNPLLAGDALTQLTSDPKFIEWVYGFAGLKADSGPQTLSTADREIQLDPLYDGTVILLAGWPAYPKKALSIGGLFMVAVTRRLRIAERPELVIYTRRAAIASGHYPAPIVRPRPCAVDPSAWDALALLLSCHRLGGEPVGQAIPIARRWLSEWASTPEPDKDAPYAKRALRGWVRDGVIRRVPPLSDDGRWTPAYYVVEEDGPPIDPDRLRATASRSGDPYRNWWASE